MADQFPEKSVSKSQIENGEARKVLSAHEARIMDQEGYIVDTEGGISSQGLKLAKDGHTVLIPQPSDDPEDPLNWSSAKKTIVLLVVSWASLLPDYGSATGAVTLIPQAKIWHMTSDNVNHSQAGNVFMLGPGGIAAVALSAYFGRLPVLFWFLVVAFATAAWCAGAKTFDSFMAARILNGFFSTVAQGGGLYFVNDMYFFNQRARKINIWAGFIILSPYFGPLFAAFITSTQHWSVAFWVYTAMTGLALILTILFVPETYYNRHAHLESRPANGSRIATLIGFHQRRVNLLEPNTFVDAMLRPIKVIMKPTAFLSVAYYCLTFAWVVGINTTLSIFLEPLYGFGALQIGYFYFTPIVAVALGEITGHWLHDAIARQYIHKHHGHFEPEVRLRAIFVSIPCMISGLVGLGFCLDRGWHYMTTSVCWGLYVFGVMIATVALNAYNLDSYPEGSGEVAAWLNQARVLGGFIISYFQVKWADSMGADKSFSVQGAIVAAAFFIVLILIKWGKSMREWSGPLQFKTI
ncbi:putative mfs transporter [Phaeomoniella chlamydospora]|uniref:Putative mfs transporter n=1 Tax=Phaeomoniella chlamydospora TaxID=158046 RepID=A0A0G2DZW8_PHACM|nr:putative mfs transporter [Phaeomoniella chlamydospora]